MKYIIANWKAHFNVTEANDWCKRFAEKLSNGNATQTALAENKLRIIIAPPYPLIPIVRAALPETRNIYIAAQDLSKYDKGNYTGEVPASTLTNIVRYAIVGHSERRTFYKESDQDIGMKIVNAAAQVIEPILCIRGINDMLHDQANYIAYEPVDSIGTGHNASPELVLQVKQSLGITAPKIFIYGGSVNPDTCKQYLQNPDIDGILVGTASLDPDSFYSIITQV